MTQVTISTKNQITIPKKTLTAIGAKSGNKLMVRQSEQMIILEPLPKNLSSYYRGIGKAAWEKIGGGEKHIKEERKSWE